MMMVMIMTRLHTWEYVHTRSLPAKFSNRLVFKDRERIQKKKKKVMMRQEDNDNPRKFMNEAKTQRETGEILGWLKIEFDLICIAFIAQLIHPLIPPALIIPTTNKPGNKHTSASKQSTIFSINVAKTRTITKPWSLHI